MNQNYLQEPLKLTYHQEFLLSKTPGKDKLLDLYSSQKKQATTAIKNTHSAIKCHACGSINFTNTGLVKSEIQSDQMVHLKIKIFDLETEIIRKNHEIDMLEELLYQKSTSEQKYEAHLHMQKIYLQQIEKMELNMRSLQAKCRDVSHLNSRLRLCFNKYMKRNIDKSLLTTFQKTIKLITCQYPEIRNIWISIKKQFLGQDSEFQEMQRNVQQRPQLCQQKYNIMDKLLIKSVK